MCLSFLVALCSSITAASRGNEKRIAQAHLRGEDKQCIDCIDCMFPFLYVFFCIKLFISLNKYKNLPLSIFSSKKNSLKTKETPLLQVGGIQLSDFIQIKIKFLLMSLDLLGNATLSWG